MWFGEQRRVRAWARQARRRGGRSEMSEKVRGQARGEERAGITWIIIIITINWLHRGEGGTCPSCRRKGYTAKI